MELKSLISFLAFEIAFEGVHLKGGLISEPLSS